MALAKANNYDAYKSTEISTANQGKLIVMLYDGAIRFLRIATDNMQPRSYDLVNNQIIKAQDIITELMLALNMDQGGEIAKNLFNIYAYLKKRLLEGNISKDVGVLEEVITRLEELKGAWEEVARKEIRKPASTRSEAVERGVSFSIEG